MTSHVTILIFWWRYFNRELICTECWYFWGKKCHLWQGSAAGWNPGPLPYRTWAPHNNKSLLIQKTPVFSHQTVYNYIVLEQRTNTPPLLENPHFQILLLDIGCIFGIESASQAFSIALSTLLWTPFFDLTFWKYFMIFRGLHINKHNVYTCVFLIHLLINALKNLFHYLGF